MADIARLGMTIFVVSTCTVIFILIWCLQVTFKYLTWFFVSEATREDVCGFIFRFISNFAVTKCNPFWRAHQLNKFPKVNNKKIIVMMNHLSSADPFLACGALLPRDGSWVAKHDLFTVPIGGWQLYNAGDLPVVFKSKGDGFDVVKGTVRPMMEKARAKLRRGRMLCIFPEGTRNPQPEGDLCPFRLGFFQLALEEGATIVPMAISGTQYLWPPKSNLVGSGDAYMTFGDPVEVSGFTDAQELADHVRKIIADLRETHPDRVERSKKLAAGEVKA